MRYSLVMLYMLMMTYIASAQDYRDVVYLKNGSVIKGFYKELYTNDTIRMKTLDGSLLICPMSDVIRIAKERTDVYVINQENQSLTYNRKWRKSGYSGSIEVFAATNTEDNNVNSIALYTTHGYRFNRHIFLGAGIGAERYTWNVSNIKVESQDITIPVYAETRLYVMNTRIAPIILCRGGYSVSGVTGVFVSPGIGVDFGISPRSAGFIRLQYRWQKYKYKAPDLNTVGFPMISKNGDTSYLMMVGGFRF